MTIIRKEDGIRAEEHMWPTQEWYDTYLVLRAFFEPVPPLEPSESNSDA